MPAILLLIAVLAVVDIEGDATCDRKLDLLFGVGDYSTVCGGSSEPCDRWYAILQFCKDIVNSLTIGPYDTRVAFITFSNTTNVEWNLQRYTDRTSLLSAIDNVTYTGGEFIDLVSALQIITAVFNPLKGDRVGFQDIGILITDGTPKINDEIHEAASAAVQASGVAVFVVCDQPGCTEQFAQGMASLPKTVNETYFLIDDYLSIDQVRDNLVKKFCAYGTIGQLIQTSKIILN